MWAWVWTEPPDGLDAFTGGIIRAANGDTTRSKSGFDFRVNWDHWSQVVDQPLMAWTFLYPTSDPIQSAHVLAAADAVGYVVDWEDYQGGTASGEKLALFCEELRRLRPGRPIGFSTYPTKAQTAAHGIDWAHGLMACDFVSPQVYFGYQVAEIDQTITDSLGRTVQVALSPGDYADWAKVARSQLENGRGVSLWRLGTLTATQRLTAAQLTEEYAVAIDPTAIRSAIGLGTDEQVATDRDIRTLLFGDPTHPNNLTALGNAVRSLASAVNGNTAAILELSAKVDQGAAGGGVQVDAAAIVTEAGRRLAIPVVTITPPAAAADETPPPPPAVPEEA